MGDFGMQLQLPIDTSASSNSATTNGPLLSENDMSSVFTRFLNSVPSSESVSSEHNSTGTEKRPHSLDDTGSAASETTKLEEALKQVNLSEISSQVNGLTSVNNESTTCSGGDTENKLSLSGVDTANQQQQGAFFKTVSNSTSSSLVTSQQPSHSLQHRQQQSNTDIVSGLSNLQPSSSSSATSSIWMNGFGGLQESHQPNLLSGSISSQSLQPPQQSTSFTANIFSPNAASSITGGGFSGGFSNGNNNNSASGNAVNNNNSSSSSLLSNNSLTNLAQQLSLQQGLLGNSITGGISQQLQPNSIQSSKQQLLAAIAAQRANQSNQFSSNKLNANLISQQNNVFSSKSCTYPTWSSAPQQSPWSTNLSINSSQPNIGTATGTGVPISGSGQIASNYWAASMHNRGRGGPAGPYHGPFPGSGGPSGGGGNIRQSKLSPGGGGQYSQLLSPNKYAGASPSTAAALQARVSAFSAAAAAGTLPPFTGLNSMASRNLSAAFSNSNNSNNLLQQHPQLQQQSQSLQSSHLSATAAANLGGGSVTGSGGAGGSSSSSMLGTAAVDLTNVDQSVFSLLSPSQDSSNKQANFSLTGLENSLDLMNQKYKSESLDLLKASNINSSMTTGGVGGGNTMNQPGGYGDLFSAASGGGSATSASNLAAAAALAAPDFDSTSAAAAAMLNSFTSGVGGLGGGVSTGAGSHNITGNNPLNQNPLPSQYSLDPALAMQMIGVGADAATLGYGVDTLERFSRKVFVGGLPPDIDEEEIQQAFRHFGLLVVDWPHKAESKSYFPPKGYCFLLFQDELSVQALMEACIAEDNKLYWCVSSPTMKDKPVQIRPWNLADSDYVMDGSQPLDPRKTIFVGGVPRPLRAVELATIMDRLYGNVCYAGIDTDPELKYPKGAGRVAFSNQQSYIAAISARFVQLQHGDIDKRVEVKPYVLDDQLCDECSGIKCQGKFAPFFCANVTCLQYYCEFCWTQIHALPGREFHKPLVKEGADRPRALPFRRM